MIIDTVPSFLSEEFDSATGDQVKSTWIILVRDLFYSTDEALYLLRLQEIEDCLRTPQTYMLPIDSSFNDDLLTASLIEPFTKPVSMPNEIHASIDELLYIHDPHPQLIERGIANILAAAIRHIHGYPITLGYTDEDWLTRAKIAPVGSLLFRSTIIPAGEKLTIEIQANPYRIRLTRYGIGNTPIAWGDFIAVKQDTAHLARYAMPFTQGLQNLDFQILITN